MADHCFLVLLVFCFVVLAVIKLLPSFLLLFFLDVPCQGWNDALLFLVTLCSGLVFLTVFL